MKLLPDLWIAHPAADGCPVPLWRWLLWQWSEFLYGACVRLNQYHAKVEHRALYGKRLPDDDIPF